jgi:hypothetical protein
MSFTSQFTITNRIAAGFTFIECSQGFLEAATLSENWVCEIGDRALVLKTHTTHTEGTKVVLEQAVSS